MTTSINCAAKPVFVHPVTQLLNFCFLRVSGGHFMINLLFISVVNLCCIVVSSVNQKLRNKPCTGMLSLRQKKHGCTNPNSKQNDCFFFHNIQRVSHTDWVTESQIVKQNYYMEVLTTLYEQVKRNSSEMWKNNSWILHQDYRLVHDVLSVKVFMVKSVL